MNARHPAPIVVTAVFAVLFAAACTDGPGEPASSEETPDEALDEAPDETEDEAEDSTPVESTVTPSPGNVDVEATPWESWEMLDDDTMLIVFPSRGAPCQVLERVEVVSSADAVEITLFQGRAPDLAASEPCDGPVRGHGVEVDVGRTYGPDDTVTDGYAG